MNTMDDYTISTPEQLNLSYTIAGLGTRFLALAVDTLIQGICAFVLLLSLAQLPVWDSLFAEWYIALLIVLGALIFYAYFLIFELLMKGRTPGKALLKIRVVRQDGRAADAAGLILRNLIRLIDFLPSFYTVGVICMFINKDSRRLGDLVAGTVVVVDRKRVTLDTIISGQPLMPNQQLNAQEQAMIRDFLARREQLTSAARLQLSQQIADPLYERFGIPLGQRDHAETFLERIYYGS